MHQPVIQESASDPAINERSKSHPVIQESAKDPGINEWSWSQPVIQEPVIQEPVIQELLLNPASDIFPNNHRSCLSVD